MPKAKKTEGPKAPTPKAVEEVLLYEEHKVFSHLMYILFLITGGLAAWYTYWMFALEDPGFFPVKALVMLGWAFIFKTLGHRIHPPHY